MRHILASAIGLALLAAPAGAASDIASSTGGANIRLSAQVPVICRLSYQGEVSAEGGSFRLGQIKQFCNAPQGFTVSVDYSPGRLINASLRIGAREITLDGSGHAEVYRGEGPQIRVFDVSAVPGSSGFDADRLEFHIEPN